MLNLRIKELFSLTCCKQLMSYLTSLLLFAVLASLPLVVASLKGINLGIGLLPTILYSLPIISMLLLLKSKWMIISLMSVICIGTLFEISMLLIGGSLLESGMIIAILTTTKEEATAVANSNLAVLWYLIPVLFLYVGVCALYFRTHQPKLSIKVFLFILCFVLTSAHYTIKGADTLLIEQQWHENAIFNRPPYRFYCKLSRAVNKIIIQKKMVDAAKNLCDFTYNATRGTVLESKEVYLFCIGESMRYENVSMNNTYERKTTPCLENTNNIILYSNYYSTACLTMYAVPLLITPATPSTFDLTYTTRSIFAPFKESGFKTFIIATKGQLLTYADRSYLSLGVDSMIIVENDVDIIDKIDTLTELHSKCFIMSELWGSHHPYYNYPPEYEIYSPTNHTDPSKFNDEKFFINSYDNTILYTDYILSSVIESLDKKNICSALFYTSDHGESISNDRYGHGFEHYPTPRDKY